jgi:biopolymer transport protein ExbD
MAVSLTAENSRWSPSKAAARRAAKRRSQFYCGVDLTGLLSVELALLIIFMTVTPPYHHTTVDLPRVSRFSLQPGANRDDAIHVLVSRDGRVYLNLARIATSELHDQLCAAVKNGSEPKVYLSVDSRARNGDVEPVINEIRAAGIVRVTVMTQSQSGSSSQLSTEMPIPYQFWFPGPRFFIWRGFASTLRGQQIRKSTDPAR